MYRFQLLVQFQLVCLCAKYPDMGLLTEHCISPCNYADIHVKVVLDQ